MDKTNNNKDLFLDFNNLNLKTDEQDANYFFQNVVSEGFATQSGLQTEALQSAMDI